MVFNVLLSFGIDCLDYLVEIVWNLVLAALKYVLVNNDEVCGFGVVRDLPLALQAVDKLREFYAPRFCTFLTEK